MENVMVGITLRFCTPLKKEEREIWETCRDHPDELQELWGKLYRVKSMQKILGKLEDYKDVCIIRLEPYVEKA